eukprot:1325979-Prymnesium_polylepis.2
MNAGHGERSAWSRGGQGCRRVRSATRSCGDRWSGCRLRGTELRGARTWRDRAPRRLMTAPPARASVQAVWGVAASIGSHGGTSGGSCATIRAKT